MTQKEADRACSKLGLKLVSFDSKEEHDFIVKLYNEKKIEKAAYTGITRGADNVTWTRNDGSSIDFTMKFFSGEPNNVFSNENCIEIKNWSYQGVGINDIPCNEKLQFICVKA